MPWAPPLDESASPPILSIRPHWESWSSGAGKGTLPADTSRLPLQSPAIPPRDASCSSAWKRVRRETEGSFPPRAGFASLRYVRSKTRGRGPLKNHREEDILLTRLARGDESAFADLV